MKILKNNRAFLILIFITVVGLGYWMRNRAPKVENQNTAKVVRQDVIQRVTISGNIVPIRKTIITGPYKGYIRKMYVKIGDKVKVGDPIAIVSTSLTMNDPAFPLRAPFTGTVVAVEKSEGEFVKESDPTDFIARIDDLSKFYIEAIAPEIDRVKIKLGQDAIVRASAILDRTYKAVIREMSLSSKEKDRWERGTSVDYSLRLEVLDPDAQINSGMSVLIDIVAQKKENTLFIRHEFINKSGDIYFARLENGEIRNLKLGLQNEDGAEILEGLSEGDKIPKVNFLEETDKK